MKIQRLEFQRVDMRLEEPYTIAYETLDRTSNVFIRLIPDSGPPGHGCAAPDLHVTGETPEDVLRALEEVARPLLEGRDPTRPALLLEELQQAIPELRATRAGLDMALHDLLGKVTGQPLWRLLGGYRDAIATSITIGILPLDETLEAARRFLAQGFRVLKLKGGSDLEGDVERVRKVRALVGDRIDLRFDANQGFTVAESMSFVELTRAARLEILEQPTPADSPEKLGAVTEESHVPVMADESLRSLVDAIHLVRNDLADMVNVKLQKVGGLAVARRIDALARSAHLETMVGCMDEAALSIAAGLAFALSHRNVYFADLDGHLDLVGDPSAGLVELRDGMLIPSEAPGLGWAPAED